MSLFQLAEAQRPNVTFSIQTSTCEINIGYESSTTGPSRHFILSFSPWKIEFVGDDIPSDSAHLECILGGLDPEIWSGTVQGLCPSTCRFLITPALLSMSRLERVRTRKDGNTVTVLKKHKNLVLQSAEEIFESRRLVISILEFSKYVNDTSNGQTYENSNWHMNILPLSDTVIPLPAQYIAYAKWVILEDKQHRVMKHLSKKHTYVSPRSMTEDQEAGNANPMCTYL
ncbi:hypothetical protein C8R43DRAFT_1106478 [Mycena crocata]|nr:hypothetical protein C8R43DRAFT_1106478 [Mycena crocata]